MEKLEKPLTWILIIGLLGYLFVANFKCGEEISSTLNNESNISNPDLNGDILKVNVDEAAEITYYKNEWGEDSLDINGNRVSVIFETKTKE